jgi:gliding motility-associated-like protein
MYTPGWYRGRQKNTSRQPFSAVLTHTCAMIHTIKRILLGFCALLLSTIQASAQTVAQATPEQAVAFLIGDNNVVVTNIQFTGQPEQLGILSDFTPASFPLSGGLVISSAAANALTDDLALDQFSFDPTPDADLLEVANSVPPLINQGFLVEDINDKAILEFDFVASGDILSFNYVFGSDEYNEWINSQFNDVFAFFLSGPDITGDFSSPAEFPGGSINIAIVPNSNPALPITISSVNGQLNADFYIDNTEGGEDIFLDGYTVLLTATYPVTCGETYHMRLAVADGSDPSLKSSVVFQEGSFDVATDISLTPVALTPINGLPEGTLLEGCIDGYLEITVPCQFDPQEVPLTIGGSALPGQDYTYSGPTTLNLIPGETIVLDVQTIYDGFEESTETVEFSFSYNDTEGVVQNVVGIVPIQNYNELQVIMPDVFLCPGTTENVTINPIGGQAPFTYAWSTGDTDATVNFSSDEVGEYWINLSDFCESAVSDTFSIVLPEPFQVVDSLIICLGVTSDPIVSGGVPPYIFEFDADDVSLNELAFDGIIEGPTPVTVTDQCNQTESVVAWVTRCQTTIPNAFSPNSSGKNNVFSILGLEFFPNSGLKVWNRWGTLVYEQNPYQNGWTADELPDGTYFYEFIREDGKVFSGEVTVFR